ncbi:MAG: tRNA glutamyl-Q(34) synthetase GluQRS [Halieaceae bacterium]|jgi:glutamyl-Q tRNA(Asp) synthetase|nr:tRNA glutamyl-Q(34) synthetase GluQRS [Halieaceae bacterium]
MSPGQQHETPADQSHGARSAIEAGVYRGRFAPSPTGPLHFGSLIAALASYLDARHHGGEWLLRIEDLDPPREVAGAADAIRASLEGHGLEWDGLLYQSQRHDAYDEALARLRTGPRLFRCCCTRSRLGPGGCCGRRCSPGADDRCALRFSLDGSESFEDLVLGKQCMQLPEDVALRRRDGLYAYALAVVVDDAQQGITHVLRGRDLLEQTGVQLALLRHLGYAPPAYGHIPLLVDGAGNKLSKQTGAPAIDDHFALDNLRRALAMLGQTSADAPAASAQELLMQASASWTRRPLAERGQLSVEHNGSLA